MSSVCFLFSSACCIWNFTVRLLSSALQKCVVVLSFSVSPFLLSVVLLFLLFNPFAQVRILRRLVHLLALAPSDVFRPFLVLFFLLHVELHGLPAFFFASMRSLRFLS